MSRDRLSIKVQASSRKSKSACNRSLRKSGSESISGLVPGGCGGQNFSKGGVTHGKTSKLIIGGPG